MKTVFSIELKRVNSHRMALKSVQQFVSCLIRIPNLYCVVIRARDNPLSVEADASDSGEVADKDGRALQRC